MNVYPYWIDPDLNIWTKVNLPAHDILTLYIRRVSGHSPDGNKTFDFFDDASRLFSDKWTIIEGFATYDVIDNSRAISLSKPQTIIRTTSYQLPSSFIIEADLYTDSLIALLYYQDASPSMDKRYHACINIQINQPECLVKDDKVISGVDSWITPNKYVHVKLVCVNGRHEWYVNDKISAVMTDTTYTNGYLAFCYKGKNVGAIRNLYIRKYAEQEPIVTTKQVLNDLWKVTITNPNDIPLTDFQVKIPGKGIVTSVSNSLHISKAGSLIHNIPYTLPLLSNISTSTASFVRRITTITFKKRLLLYLSQNISDFTNCILYIPPNVETFWKNRGKYLLLTDKNGNILQFTITSESINELYGVVYNLANYTTNDVFYLYFDDGLQRDLSYIVPNATRPDIDNNIVLGPKHPGQGTIIRFKFTPTDIFPLNTLSVYYNGQPLPYHYNEEESKTYVKFPTTLTDPEITLYLYPFTPELLEKIDPISNDVIRLYLRPFTLELEEIDAIVYDAKILSLQIESRGKLSYTGRFAINGHIYAVIQKFVEDVPKIGVYAIENAPDSVENYGLYSRQYKVILYITSKSELDSLIALLQNEKVTLDWDDETFEAIPIHYNNEMILSGDNKTYKVTITFRRLYDKRIN